MIVLKPDDPQAPGMSAAAQIARAYACERYRDLSNLFVISKAASARLRTWALTEGLERAALRAAAGGAR